MYRVPHLRADEKMFFDATPYEEAKSSREKILKPVWTSHVKDEFGLVHLIQTNAQFSCAIAVMDRIGGWIEEGRHVGLFKGSHMQRPTLHGIIRNQKKNSIVEAVNSVCASVQDNHDCISEFFLVLQENKFWYH